jgi:predicted adenylyl cyclase CyaB
MARNIEVKARVANLDALAPRAAALADTGPVAIAQDDTFFACERGRLKLRVFADRSGELIHYRRPDERGPKESLYVIAPVSAPDALREALSRAYGVAGRVRKVRTLYLAGRTRIHLDRVEGLGDFLELEVVLRDGEPAEAGVEEAHGILRRLGVEPGQLVEGAYLDLIADGNR